MGNVSHRMNHIFKNDGRTFIMALNHGANFNVLLAMKDTGRLIKDIALAGADAFLATVGMADKFADCFMGKGIILRVDGGVSFFCDPKKLNWKKNNQLANKY